LSQTSSSATKVSAEAVPTDGLIALLILYVLWGSTFLGIKFALESFPPFLLGATRFPIAGGLMFIFLRLRGAPLPTRRQFLHCTIYGVLLIGLGNGLIALAENYVSSGLTSALTGASPLVIALLSGLFGKWPRKLEWLGIMVGLSGLILINSGDEMRGNTIGLLAIIASTLTWALGSVLAREKLDLPGGAMTTSIELFTGGVLQLAISTALGEQMKPLTTTGAGGWIFLLFASIVGFTSYTIVLRRLRPVLATSFSYVNPIVAIILGILLGGETISGVAVLGVAVTLAGVVFITLAQTRRASAANES
jgi:drug/metabolite transporter (DMT)-like permease